MHYFESKGQETHVQRLWGEKVTGKLKECKDQPNWSREGMIKDLGNSKLLELMEEHYTEITRRLLENFKKGILSF